MAATVFLQDLCLKLNIFGTLIEIDNHDRKEKEFTFLSQVYKLHGITYNDPKFVFVDVARA